MQENLLKEERAKTMWVCQGCLGDYILKMHCRELVEAKNCHVCHESTLHAISSEEIAERVKKYLPMHFELDLGHFPGYELKLKDIVGLTIRCESPDVHREVAACLEIDTDDDEDFYWKGQEYCAKSSPFESEEDEREYAISHWRAVAQELTHGRRFFNDTAHSFFDWLISEALAVKNPGQPDLPALATTIEPGTSFYRARVARDEKESRSFAANPQTELGAAPKERAANNRMSPAGISLLYVAREYQTTIAEVRPSIGDLVAVGKFKSTKQLRVFDFSMLSRSMKLNTLSYLDASFKRRSDMQMLLKYLHEEIARPIRASDTDYVVTQVLAEFIRYEKKWKFDGIAFQSVQRKGGLNYVLFDRSEPEELAASNGAPKFHLSIDAGDVSMYTIEGVSYNHELAS